MRAFVSGSRLLVKPSTPLPRRVLLVRALAAGLLALPALLLMGARPPEAFRNATFETDPDRLVFVTAHWRDRAQLQRIASKFQHLMIDEKAHTARMEASSDDLLALRRLGVRYEIDEAATERMRQVEGSLAKREMMVQQGALMQTTSGLTAQKLVAERAIPGFACYRTVEETYGTMDQLVARRPSIAQVLDIGPSWVAQNVGAASGYRMRVLRLNNTATDASIPNKPNIVVLSAIHAREYTTAELTTRFAEWLVNTYGVDPQATWMVDNFRFHFILQGNPDGRKKAESGLSWRKNVDTANGSCSANAYGVDLNRNFTWSFGTVAGGSSSDACDATYRGPSAASETEVQNLMRYIVGTRGTNGTYSGGVLADRRTDTGVAPADYRGLFLDIHSYSQMVLWPWANTSTAAPNSVALRTLGRRMAYFNNYSPRQWIGLYAADGTNTDTIYGITGAPSYTVELGQAFFEDCNTFESTTFPQNFEMLQYAARNAFSPYTSPGGPDTTSIGASAGSVVRGQAFAVSAYFDDARFNQSNGAEAVQAVTSASAWVDGAPWSGAAPIAMAASDGAFNTSREQAVVNINTAGLAPGKHVVFVRGTDASGTAGAPRAIYFTVRATAPPPVHDFDGDRGSDLVWRNASTGANSIWRSANSAAAMPVSAVANQAWKIEAQGDFDGDGRSDLFWRNQSTGQNVIWRSANSAAPIAVATATDRNWHVVGAGDFDADGRSDLVWRNASTGQNAIWRSGNNTTAIAVTAVTNPAWRIVGVGDFDGDGRADLLWRNGSTGGNAVWLAGNAATPLPMTAVTNLSWKIVGVGDFDNDGLSDVFFRNVDTGANAIWRGANNASQIATTAVTNTAWRVTSVGDFNADGRADVMWRNGSSGANAIWLGGNSATAQTVTTVGGTTWSVVPYENQP